jgi:mRNA-degrading endonuclease toxin of MazEF toxin-antitoxin module
MDLKDQNNREQLDSKINTLLSDYRDLFDSLLGSADTYKKAALLYYWLHDYRNYIKNEPTFDPKYYPELFRGNIVNLNLGFNIGSEIGGLHYAVVLQHSTRHSPNITVLPLTSVKPGKDIQSLRPTELYIGQELYFKIQGKFEALKISLPTEVNLLREMVTHEKLTDEMQKTTSMRLKDLDNKTDLLLKTNKKLASLKHGSIVVMNQIRTVSKMRIMDPTDRYDILYNLKLSPFILNEIDNKIVTLFTNKS